MITNTPALRIALQAVLATVLATHGFWGCAVMVVFILLPWKPILAAGGDLVQPIVDWRIQAARDRQGKSLPQIEQELDVLLHVPKAAPQPSGPVSPASFDRTPRPFPSLPTSSLRCPRPVLAAKPVTQRVPKTPPSPALSSAISPAICNHVRNFPKAAFSNMELHLEDVKVQGETAEAFVRFQSPRVADLVVHQHYFLRKAGEQWQVESLEPAKAASRMPSQAF